MLVSPSCQAKALMGHQPIDKDPRALGLGQIHN